METTNHTGTSCLAQAGIGPLGVAARIALATAGGAFLFYGVSMFVAASRRSGAVR